MPTHGEMIDEISRRLPKSFTRKQLINAIIEKYGRVRAINIDSLSTDISGCCVNLTSHGSLPSLPLILVSLGQGKYRRYNSVSDRNLNLYLKKGGKKPKIERRGGVVRKARIDSPKAEVYSYNGAERVLREKGLLGEVRQIVDSIHSINHNHIQDLFSQKGWDVEYKIHSRVRWAWDAYKDRVPVSIELSLIDAVHRDFLRLLLWDYEDKVDAVVYITSTNREPKFKNVKRDLEIFRPIFKIPVLLIGLS